MARLIDLPEEVILQIHYLAESPFFPQTHPVIYRHLHHASAPYIARWLLRIYRWPYDVNEILMRSVRHPICNLAVVKDMKRIWDDWRGWPAWVAYEKLRESRAQRAEQRRKRPGNGEGSSTGAVVEECPSGDEEEELPARPPMTKAPPLSCVELPRRLFRAIDPKRPIPELLDYLITQYKASADSHKGYPLCRAVYSGQTTLIKYLLEHGADPGIKGNLPVQIAIQKGRLDTVKVLVESSTAAAVPMKEDLKGVGRDKKQGGSPAKKARRSDRVSIDGELVELAIRGGHDKIVQYFVHEKGIMPPLRSILKLGGPKTTVSVTPRASKQAIPSPSLSKTALHAKRSR